MADDSLTARNRINQRNFRARRQNYIKELEERIRKYELEGVQATIEVQAAARQVTDQNIKLRNLLVQKFGMSEYELSNYLGFQQQSPLVHGQSFQTAFAPNSQLANLAPAPASTTSCGLAPKPQIPVDMVHSYPTPPQQFDPPRNMTSAHLDPALSLASLHKFPSLSHDQVMSQDQTSSRHNSDHSISHSIENRSSPYEPFRGDSPTDTLSESSNPSTPAEQPLADPAQTTQPQATSQKSCCNTQPVTHPTHVGLAPRPNDETSCEEAARIIASMRGGTGSTDQVLLELGCGAADTKCKVKNLSIFQLMDTQ